MNNFNQIKKISKQIREKTIEIENTKSLTFDDMDFLIEKSAMLYCHVRLLNGYVKENLENLIKEVEEDNG